MNYLYQAALTSLYSTPAQPQLCRFYIHTMKNISQRLVLRLDPSIKRTLCKGCDSLLIPGITCTSRLQARRQKHVSVTCLTCSKVKRFVIDQEHTLWTERSENVASSGDTASQPCADS
eukprot:Em0020g885a